MIYYKHFIGDYQRKTNRLSILEDGVYRRLLDEYYSNESPLPIENDTCFRLVRAIKASERRAVLKILSLYFTKTPSGYIQGRADHQILEYKGKSEQASQAARTRWDAKEPVTDMRTDMRTDMQAESCGSDAIPDTNSQIPNTTNHKPQKAPPISPKGDGTPAHRIFTCWNSHDALIHHQNLNPRFQKPINARLKDGYSEADLCKAIGEYARLCQIGQAPGHNKWTLAELMSRGQGDWLDKILNGNGAITGARSSTSKSQTAMEETQKNMEVFPWKSTAQDESTYLTTATFWPLPWSSLPPSIESPITPQLSEIYLKALGDLTVKDFKDAVNHLVKTSKYFPKPAEIREAVGLISTSRRLGKTFLELSAFDTQSGFSSAGQY